MSTIRLDPADAEFWNSLSQLAKKVSIEKWVLVGGQMVRLHAAIEGVEWPRVTTDGDIAVDIRTHQRIAMKEVAEALLSDGFAIQPSAEGVSRFQKGSTSIDLLAPEGSGSLKVETAHGAHAIQAPGTTQALQRAIKIHIEYLSERLTIRIPSLIGAIIGKAAACSEIPSLSSTERERHEMDMFFLLGLLAKYDVLQETRDLSDRDRNRVFRAAMGILKSDNHPAFRMLKNVEDIVFVLDKIVR
jgi:hypothetical protein